ncbi:MAG: ABC-2 transporter permease, partial [Calditrichaeota bacterium]|nr:ABC-2 transporter permease [Calditrichota bacterium]
MFKPIFFVEIQFWRKQLSIYLYAIFFLLVSLLSIAGSAGFFDGPSLDSGPFEWVNSPVRLHRTIQLFNQLILFLLPGIIGVSIYRDFRSNSYHLLYSYPFKKSDYLAAKFLSSLLVTILIVVCIAIGLIIGTNLPGLDNRQLGPFNGFAYLQTYLVYLVPNIIVFGAIVFAVVTMTRNIYAGFITVILLIILKTILSALLNGVENRELAAILDPFGNSAALYGLNEWSLTDRNTRLLPLHRLILYNRFLYMGIAGLICAWMYRTFNLSQAGAFVRLKKTTAKPQQLAVEPIDKLNIRFDLKSRLKTIIFLSSVDQRFMFRSWMFQLILIGGIVLVFLQQAQMNPSYGFKLLPVTWKMLKLPTFFFSAVINMLTFLYAGILVQRARQSNCDQLLAVSPVSDASLLIARFIGLLRTQAILLLLIPIAGIAVQLVNGFTDIDLQLYFVDLYGLNLISFAIWAALALFIQSLLTNPYLGFFILLCIPMAISGLPELGLQHPIFQFNRGDYSYSELSGYEGLARYWIYKLYWSLLALSFLLTAFAIQNRGVEQGLVDRLRLLKRRVSARFYTVIAFVLIAFMAMAIYLYRADQSQDLLSKAEQANILRSKKAAYQIYADLPQPKIVSLDIDLAFYP